MTTFRIASVALAASAIIASNPAAANGFKTQNTFSNSVLVKKQIAAVSGIHARRALPVTRTQFANGNRFNRGVRTSFQQTAQLKRHALASCTAQLRRDAYSFGYRGAQLTGANVKQVGRNKFVVNAGAKLHDGYSFSHELYNCTVAHGQVIDAYKPKKLRF